MKVGKLILPVVMLLAGMLASSTQSFATHEYTKKEKKACTYCHVAANSKELNEAGQYYAAHNRSLEGFAAKTAPAKK